MISTDQVLHGPRDPARHRSGRRVLQLRQPARRPRQRAAGRRRRVVADAARVRPAFSDGGAGTVTVDPTRADVLRPLAGRAHRAGVHRVRAGAERRGAVGDRRPALPVDAVQDRAARLPDRWSRRSRATRRWTRTTRRSRSRRCGSSAPTARTTRASWCASRSSAPTAHAHGAAQHLPDRRLHRHLRAEPRDRSVRDRDRRRPSSMTARRQGRSRASTLRGRATTPTPITRQPRTARPPCSRSTRWRRAPTATSSCSTSRPREKQSSDFLGTLARRGRPR